VTFVAGIGLLRRWRWARFYMIALLFVVVAMLAKDLRILPPSGPTTTVGSDGVPTTTFHSGSSDALPTLAVSIVLLAVLFSAKVRAVFAAPAAPVEEQKVPPSTMTHRSIT
jgi:hypothetical protein